MSYDQRPTKIRVVKGQPKPGEGGSAPAAGAAASAPAAGTRAPGAKAPAAAKGGPAKAGASKASAGTPSAGRAVVAANGASGGAVASPTFWLIGGSLFLVASAVGGAAAMAVMFH